MHGMTKWTRKLVLAAAAVALAGGTSLATLSPAAASAPGPPPTSGAVASSYGPFRICMYVDPDKCWRGHGKWNQFTIDLPTTNTTTITFVSAGSWNGVPAYVLKDDAGNCLLESSNTAIVAANGCNTGQDNQRYALYESPNHGGYFMLNVQYGHYISVVRDAYGADVWGGPITQYYHWDLCEVDVPYSCQG